MANYQIAKPIIDGILHLKDCPAKGAECEQCLKAAVQIAGALSEVVEVAELIRRLSQMTAPVPMPKL